MGDDVLADRYRRLASLGRGSMGEVWLADDLWLHRQVAVKMLRVDPAAGEDSASADRMLREARAAAQLHDPHVVEVFDLVIEAGQPCVVMEYVDGESLAERIGRLGPLGLVDAARLIGQVAGALHAAHRAGIVHGDVKPANILIDAAGNAKLADFGIARGAGGFAAARTGQMTGTLAYLAPEVARTGKATSASDVWSMGATLYAAVQGRAPYDDDDGGGQDPASLLARLVTPMPPPTRSAELTPILLQMLRLDNNRGEWSCPASPPNGRRQGR